MQSGLGWSSLSGAFWSSGNPLWLYQEKAILSFFFELGAKSHMLTLRFFRHFSSEMQHLSDTSIHGRSN